MTNVSNTEKCQKISLTPNKATERQDVVTGKLEITFRENIIWKF
jgi:hypothetical protein